MAINTHLYTYVTHPAEHFQYIHISPKTTMTHGVKAELNYIFIYLPPA